MAPVQAASPNNSLNPTLLSRILVRIGLPLQRFGARAVPLRRPQGRLARPRYIATLPLLAKCSIYPYLGDLLVRYITLQLAGELHP